FKTDAVHDRILNINPDAEVVTFTSTIQDVPDGEWARLLGPDTIIIGGGDNRESSAYGCNLAAKYGSPFLSTCCWTRAHAGEIFYWLPDSGMICYSCAFNKLLSDARPESNHIYVGEDDVELLQQGRITFEPGVSVDINFVTDIALKLILDIINRDNGAYTPRVINYLRQYTFVCNTNETRVGGPRAAIFEHPLQVTRNLTLTSTPMPDCPYCAHAE
ncbi:MAG: hypothetical protein LBN99_02045, partial [Oscillospiraceae bacterium]|nr:hypothetical protein [Oscillospiraceae bacterium]